MKVNIMTETDGKGYWSNEIKEVKIVKLEIGYLADDEDEDEDEDGKFGELRAYFKKSQWDIKKNGLIYTDDSWLEDFQEGLLHLGFSPAAIECIEYSEQGMQGQDYVSLDFCGCFYQEWLSIAKETVT